MKKLSGEIRRVFVRSKVRRPLFGMTLYAFLSLNVLGQYAYPENMDEKINEMEACAA